jgi:hypothetical protein
MFTSASLQWHLGVDSCHHCNGGDLFALERLEEGLPPALVYGISPILAFAATVGCGLATSLWRVRVALVLLFAVCAGEGEGEVRLTSMLIRL